MRDRDGRLFKVYARVDSSKAGVKVVLYAKNVLLCHTEQSIEFFYQKKTKDVAAMFDTAAEKFPMPVRDNRSQRQTSDSTMLTDRNKGDEPTIYIHQESITMCASLMDAEAIKSNPVPINTPGLIS